MLLLQVYTLCGNNYVSVIIKITDWWTYNLKIDGAANTYKKWQVSLHFTLMQLTLPKMALPHTP